MKRALGDLALHRRLLFAKKALLQWGIAEPLHLLKFLATALADVFVNRHLASVSKQVEEKIATLETNSLLRAIKVNLLALYPS